MIFQFLRAFHSTNQVKGHSLKATSFQFDCLFVCLGQKDRFEHSHAGTQRNLNWYLRSASSIFYDIPVFTSIPFLEPRVQVKGNS